MGKITLPCSGECNRFFRIYIFSETSGLVVECHRQQLHARYSLFTWHLLTITKTQSRASLWSWICWSTIFPKPTIYCLDSALEPSVTLWMHGKLSESRIRSRCSALLKHIDWCSWCEACGGRMQHLHLARHATINSTVKYACDDLRCIEKRIQPWCIYAVYPCLSLYTFTILLHVKTVL